MSRALMAEILEDVSYDDMLWAKKMAKKEGVSLRRFLEKYLGRTYNVDAGAIVSILIKKYDI